MSTQPHKPWGWVRKCDELSLSMRKGHIFYNFHEGPLLFPPSFRCAFLFWVVFLWA